MKIKFADQPEVFIMSDSSPRSENSDSDEKDSVTNKLRSSLRKRIFKHSSCQVAAYLTFVILVIFEASTVFVIYRNSSNIESLKNDLLKDQQSRVTSIPQTGRIGIQRSSSENEREYDTFYQKDYMYEENISDIKIIENEASSSGNIEDSNTKTDSRLNFKILAPIDLWSDGLNDQISPSDICKNAKPDTFSRTTMNTFYTLYTPVQNQDNPDIKTVHIADHQKFRLVVENEVPVQHAVNNELVPDVDLKLQNRKTVILVHGFLSNSYGQANLIEHLFEKSDDFNLIIVDWSYLAQSKNNKIYDYQKRKKRMTKINGFIKSAVRTAGYEKAVKNRHAVAEELYHLLKFITIKIGSQDQVAPENIHIVGHSLGAHIAGEAAYYYQSTGLEIGRITGLDAAALCFEQFDDIAMMKQLDKSDADFVDVWHTNANLERVGGGLARPIGHVDFWVNGGKTQPICENDDDFDYEIGYLSRWKQQISHTRSSPCSHILVNQYFLDSIKRCDGTKKGFTANAVQADQLFKYIKTKSREKGSLYEVSNFPKEWLLKNLIKKTTGETPQVNSFFSFFSSEEKESKYFMGFWSGKTDFDSQHKIELSDASLMQEDLEFLDLDSSIFEFSGSGDFKIEEEGGEPDDQYIGEWERFWRDSQNYVVYTKTMERNPNKYKTPEKLPWSGYCE